MNRLAKAMSAGSNMRKATGLGRSVRGAFATRGASLRVNGTGAPSHARAPRTLLALAAFALLALVSASPAAAEKVHPFEETFGVAQQPSFGNATGLAVDQASGDLLVVDAAAGTVSRFAPNGEPSPFAGLGTHVIDGKKGPGELACGEEPASCDLTPQNGLTFGPAGETQIAVDNSGGLTDGNIYVAQRTAKVVQIFSDEGAYLGQLTHYRTLSNEVQSIPNPPSLGASSYYIVIPGLATPEVTTAVLNGNVNGNGVCSAINAALVAALGPGSYCGGTGLGGGTKTITFGGPLAGVDVPTMEVRNATDDSLVTLATEVTKGGQLVNNQLAAPCGVTPSQTGALFVNNSRATAQQGLHEFVPTANPPVTADNAPADNFSGLIQSCNATYGSAASATADKLFTIDSNGLRRLDAASGAIEYTVAGGHSVSPHNSVLTLNGESGFPIASSGAVATEYDASGASSGEVTVASTLTAPSAIQGMAVDEDSGEVYVSRSGSAEVEVYGAPVDSAAVTLKAATQVGGTRATLEGTVNPNEGAILDCRFEYGPTAALGSSLPCEGSIPTDSSPHPVSAELTGLVPQGQKYFFRLVATNPVGTTESETRSLSTAHIVVTQAATGIGGEAATLNGLLTQEEGAGFSACQFQYLTAAGYAANGNGYSGPATPATAPCVPAVAGIEEDNQPHPVSAALGGLQPDTDYHFRLVGTNGGGPVFGADLTFTTSGPPAIAEELPLWVEGTTAKLRALVDPNGLPTTYRFEWGTSTAYGNFAPAEFEPTLGAGEEPVPVVAALSGLAAGTEYQFRVVATNSAGTTTGADHAFETLNGCGLTQDRCLELVSPADKGPAGQAGQAVGLFAEPGGQVAPDGEAMTWLMGYGTPESHKGGESTWRSNRTDAGWDSSEFSPPVTDQPINFSASSLNSKMSWISADLRCGFLVSAENLTGDPAAESVREAGGVNLYRRNPDATHTLVSNQSPSNPGAVPFGSVWGVDSHDIAGASEDCSRVIFRTPYQYAGVPFTGVYSWDEGVLSNPMLVPGPSGEQLAPSARVGDGANRHHALSTDGSRLFFTATSALGPDSGKDAIFAREDGATVDASQSQTATPNDDDSVYLSATPDGRYVFFLGRYGLAANATSTGATNCNSSNGTGLGAGCDLYRYDVETGALLDLSADANPVDTAGAGVAGLLDVSEDGSRAYFAARGQLVPGRGNTEIENAQGAGAFNIYLAEVDGSSVSFQYVETVSAEERSVFEIASNVGLFISGYGSGPLTQAWRSRATPDGGHLIFSAAGNIAGYESGGVAEAYLFDAESGEVECVSCRRDGLPSVGTTGISATSPLPIRGSGAGAAHPTAVLSDDGSRAFFNMPDALAPGAVDGEVNLYEWHEGQITTLTTGIPGLNGNILAQLMGASADGDNVFFRTKRPLVSQDVDHQQDVYVARVGGGFAPSPPPPPACDPLSEASCQAGFAATAPALAGAASAIFQGDGNVSEAANSCRPNRVRRGQRCVAKRALAKRACAKRKGKAKRRCVRNQVRRLNRIQARRQRAIDNKGRVGK